MTETKDPWSSDFSELTQQQNNLIDEARSQGYSGFFRDRPALTVLQECEAYLKPDKVFAFEQYIVCSFGYWGCGATIKEAAEQWKKAGGKWSGKGPYGTGKSQAENVIVYLFRSDKPFRHIGDPEDNEAQALCYIDSIGYVCHNRCRKSDSTKLTKEMAK